MNNGKPSTPAHPLPPSPPPFLEPIPPAWKKGPRGGPLSSTAPRLALAEVLKPQRLLRFERSRPGPFWAPPGVGCQAEVGRQQKGWHSEGPRSTGSRPDCQSPSLLEQTLIPQCPEGSPCGGDRLWLLLLPPGWERPGEGPLHPAAPQLHS